MRRKPFRSTCGCQCVVCTEMEQLHQIASYDHDIGARVIAMAFLGAMDSVNEGRCGSIELFQLFD